nr:SbcC/MukB-like Walker B domain-containing protein [Leucobacter exalbidus]
MLDTLFGLIPAASRGQQWLAHELQLVNWGGYDGAHRVRFSPGATLLCGGSGSGKSTLMDAYIALMMPHTTPFNGASNGGVTGRPRGEDQRNILSYGRGKIDESRTEQGTRVRVLRGDGSDTWTAIAMSWIDHDGSRFTAVRAWYIPAGARVIEDTVRVRATVEGAFNLADLAPAAALRLADAQVRAAGLDTVATDREFTARVHSVLGIGAAGAGAKAMSLLARIQAGQQITTVDELYKRMVLEEPDTLAAADAVVAHFDELEGTRSRMVTAQRQVHALRPIRGMRTRIDEAIDRLHIIDEVGQLSDQGSLVSLWRADRRLGLLRKVEAELQQQKVAADAVVREHQALAETAGAERDGLVEVLRGAGGERIEIAERELREVERRLTTVRQARERFEVLCSTLDIQITSASAFGALVSEARLELSRADAKAGARDAYAEARAEVREATAQVEALEADLTHASGRNDNIPAALHEARIALAEASGIAVSDLPFVGELVEVRAEFEPWRDAFGLGLGGFATTILVNEALLPKFRAAINDVCTRVRVRYEGVRAGLPRRTDLDPATLPGRLDYRESVLTGWLQDRLDQQFSFVCVTDPGELEQHPQAITITGQLSRGRRGSHGGHGKASVLGFSNQRRIEQLTDQILAARAQHAESVAREAAAAASLDALDAQHAAYAKVAELTWEELNEAQVESDRARWAQIIADAATGSAEIAGLQQQIADAKKRVAKLQQATGRAQAEQERVAAHWAAVSDEVDAAQALVDDAADAARELSPAQTEYLDHRFLVPAEDDTRHSNLLSRFDAALNVAAKQLLDDRSAAQEALETQREALARTLDRFLENWPNPNLRADPDTSFADFERILAELEASGLHELEAEWKDSLLKLSGNDLTSLDSALGRALREMRERIDPINQIMRDLPFYDDDHRLQITPREYQTDSRRKFRRELRDVRALITDADETIDREQAYGRMERLIGRIRRTSPDFSELIDVRNHVRVSAEKVHAETGAHAALYDHIGEKSGGESQELIAFIVGAALRYQLGDAGAERPRYAPVFLDEALIKADAHFTKRAIGAWRGLGFQLVIGAPNDKYSAIEPHVDVEYDILKDAQGRSWAKPKVGLPAA